MSKLAIAALGLAALLPATLAAQASAAPRPAGHAHVAAAHAPAVHGAAVHESATHAAHTAAARPATSPRARAAAARVVTITTHEYAFDAPSTLPAGLTTFRLVNAGKEMHHVWLVRLEQGKTAADYLQAMAKVAKGEAPPPAWAIDVGGPQPGVPGALADGTLLLEAGNYAIVCHVPSPGDGVPHVAKGMIRPLTVTPAAAASRAAEPAADLEMRLTDYDFVLSAPLTAGRRTVRIVNAAEQFHEVFIARLVPGKSAQDALAWAEGGMQGPPPMIPAGGAAGMAKGRSMLLTADFAPGEYVLICFLPDAKDGKPHVAHGMVKQLTVPATARTAPSR